MSYSENFYSWQHRALGGLLAWGTGSVVVGAGLAPSRSAITRHIGLQAIAWGLIDALLALNGRRGARSRIAQPHTSNVSAEQAARRFQQIVGVNVGLDALYILAAVRLLQSSRERPQRRGIGLGILIQALFLLPYDLLLARGAAAWRG